MKAHGMKFTSPAGYKLRWLDCVRAGREIEGKLDPRASYLAIAKAFGMRSKQQAYHETLVALGKVAILLKKRVTR